MGDFITELRERRVLPAVGVYVASSWVLVEILDRLVERYLLSPYLTDIVFWGLFSLIPAIMLIAWTHGKPGKDKATRAEKVGVPINLIATLGLLITVFGGKDLNLAATQITVNNELGQQETHYIPSETFRRRMAVFFWQNESGDPELDWLQYGVTELLVQDLQQNPFILANSPWNNFSHGMYSRMRKAGFNDGLGMPRSLMREIAIDANRQYFIEGSFDRVADEFIVTARVWDSQTLEQVDELISRNWDIYAAIDQLTRDVRLALDVPESGSRIADDLPLAETYGESEEALKAYIEGLNARLFENDFEKSNAFFEKATSIDANFVLGWFLKAANMVESGDLPAAQEALAVAQKLDYRLPERDRAQLKALTYRLKGEHEKLMAFLRMRVEIYDDASGHSTLANMLMISGELQEAKTEFLQALEKDQLNTEIYLKLSALERATGNMDGAVDYARQYQQQRPEDMEANILLGDLLRDIGELDEARKQYQQAQILENDPVQPTLKLSLLAARKGDIHAALDLLTEAEGFAQTAQDEIYVRQGAVLLQHRMGKIHEAIRLTYDQEVFLRQSQPPFAVAISIYAPLIEYYLDVADTSAARGALETALGMLQAPMNQFLAFSEAMILARERDFTAAEASVERGIVVIEMFKLKVLEFQVAITRARIAEERADHVAMAEFLLEALDVIEHSVMASELQVAVPRIYAGIAIAQIRSSQLDAAEQSLAAGFRLDSFEPTLWLVKARLQQAQNMPQLALASVNYALAIWKDADDDYIAAGRAKALAAKLNNALH
jgi:tetratricopeptide (TPR) repeat protein